MSAANDKTAREERLAAKLRENLKRRKAQARAQSARDGEREGPPDPQGPDSDEPSFQ